MKFIFITICVFSFLVCSQVYATDESPTQQIIEFPDRTIDDWSIEKAVVEANDDIKNGTSKIYYSGTIAAYSPGVSEEDVNLIEGLPMANAGVGCIIEDSKLREAQFNYAKKYNETIISLLKKQHITK